ncbi:hypothetical protein [Chamaesiphon sp. OTE_75_metabat_556]|uniref:hypothetical protein n=1 Tax=Chamaesiphon sp. OTE_75_metabat_556 TaxID=2964692 RepID=UPI00286CB790|nr:hypothetical protein [Chamaesiphon sp. OTE_75_metabat_556]
MSDDIPAGSQFPDILKAKLGLKLQDIVSGMLNKDQEFFQLAQDKKVALNKQRAIDTKSFVLSQSDAIDRGNTNSCETKAKFDKIAKKQAAKVKPVVMPSSKSKSPLGSGKNKQKLPKTIQSSPTQGARSRPPSLSNTKINQALAAAIDTSNFYIQAIDANQSSAKSKRNLEKFTQAQDGQRGTSIGDRAVVFSANGTPMYGDSYLDKNLQENLAANQATSNAPISQIPKKIETGQPISPNPLQQQSRANVTPKGNTTANLIALGTIATAITAVLFLFQHVLIFVELILQISSVTSTITNIAGSFVAILNNMGSLFGLGEGLLDPLSKTFDSILNNVFGKEKVDYIKLQFAKVSAVYVAGTNMLSKVASMENSLGTVTADNANNTSKIGNALKAMNMLATGSGWMREDNKIATTTGKVGDKLSTINTLSTGLTDITNDIKSAKEQLETLDKEQESKDKATKEGEAKATEKHEDATVPDADKLKVTIS